MRENLENIINASLRMLYENDIYLIEHNVCERAIVSHFVTYFRNLAKEYEVLQHYHFDSEYNRNGTETKNLPNYEHGTYPDFIVHRRGSNGDNLLIVEFKKINNTDIAGDIEKLEGFTSPNEEYQYDYGVLIILGETFEECEFRWFRNGEEL